MQEENKHLQLKEEESIAVREKERIQRQKISDLELMVEQVNLAVYIHNLSAIGYLARK